LPSRRGPHWPGAARRPPRRRHWLRGQSPRLPRNSQTTSRRQRPRPVWRRHSLRGRQIRASHRRTMRSHRTARPSSPGQIRRREWPSRRRQPRPLALSRRRQPARRQAPTTPAPWLGAIPQQVVPLSARMSRLERTSKRARMRRPARWPRNSGNWPGKMRPRCAGSRRFSSRLTAARFSPHRARRPSRRERCRGWTRMVWSSPAAGMQTRAPLTR
jgi:hypothetical protein